MSINSGIFITLIVDNALMAISRILEAALSSGGSYLMQSEGNKSRDCFHQQTPHFVCVRKLLQLRSASRKETPVGAELPQHAGKHQT